MSYILYMMTRFQRISVVGACLLMTACGPSATKGGFDSPNPAARIYAIENAARTGDRSAVKEIVELLDSDDPAVRFVAIATLKRLTGQTFGYRDFDPPVLRRQAIARWVEAIKSESSWKNGSHRSGDSRPADVTGTVDTSRSQVSNG
jgi:hypothetical protein